MNTVHQKIANKVKRLVIKIGSALLSNEQGLNRPFFKGLVRETAILHRRGIKVVLVSSGAIACGMDILGLKKRPHQIAKKQAAAALGQPLLMHTYSKFFSKSDLNIAQILLTRDGLHNRSRFLNAKHAFHELFSYRTIPVVNENDTVAVDEIQLGDNDELAAHVAHLVDADLLLILTDTNGFHDDDPKKNADAKRIPLIENVGPDLLKKAKGTLSAKSVGGMFTKLKSAALAAKYGVATWVVDGRRPRVISRVFEGRNTGTLFLPRQRHLSARKYWIGYALKPAGGIIIDKGAAGAVKLQNKSLLPSGIVDVKGSFHIGDPVSISVKRGRPIAQGLTSYNAQELLKIRGCQTSEIEKILGYKYTDEVIHRDDLVVF